MPATQPTLKAFLNAKCGNAEAARDALKKAGFDLEEVDPKELEPRLKSAIDHGTKRILVAGGDGTIGTAADLVANTDIELAILPAGTLNHFAKDHGIPTDLGEAALVAANGVVTRADIGYVNDCVFLNTSSIGAYVTFVRDRERLEKYVGYTIASFIAAVQTMLHLRTFGVTLEVEGVKKTYRSSLIFIGVGERELKMPTLGSRVENGRRGLHVMIVRGHGKARLFALALAAIAKGTKEASRLPEFDDFIVDSCRIDLKWSHATIGLDGELKNMQTPFDYRVERDALHLVVAAPKKVE
ncbi:MAG: diacylglycerol kinase family protein [Gemmatimonadaceae bacterium]